MKTILGLIITLFIGFTVSAADLYLSGTEDVPLMDGLTVDKTDDMDFDTPAGQIVVLEAKSPKLTAEQVFDYYRKTLPHLGWVEQKTGVFKRDNDMLTLLVIRAKGPLIMRFEIAFVSGL